MEGAGDGESAPVSATTSGLRAPNAQTFGTGTLIIPLDTQSQSVGPLRAYGLVYQLLRNNVPVQWAIKSAKAVGGDDFTIDAPTTIADLEMRTPIPLPVRYRGGAFIIDAADSLAAMPTITTWLTSDAVTVVHNVTSGTFTADIAKKLTAAPRIAVLEDGNQGIAFSAFRQAGILDSQDKDWPDDSPDLVTQAAIISGNSVQGLFDVNGAPKYCHLTSMHYVDKDMVTTAKVVSEVRRWLVGNPGNHAYMQCQAITTFENDVNGKFLTDGGTIDTDGNVSQPAPNLLTNLVPEDPRTQADDTLEAIPGAVASILPKPGSHIWNGVDTLVTGEGGEIWLLSGPVGGKPANGRVTYMGGHDYVARGKFNSVKILLDSLFESGCVTSGAGKPVITLKKSAPEVISDDQITYTIEYANTGTGVAYGVVITDQLPEGTTFLNASDPGSNDAGKVTWKLGQLEVGATGSVTVTVNVMADGTFTNVAEAYFTGGAGTLTMSTNTVASNPVKTTRFPIGVSGGGCSTGGGGGLGACVLAVLALVTRRRRAVAAAAVVAGVALPHLASAQLMESGNFGVERFQLASDRDGMFNVEGAEAKGNMAISAALWAGLANDPLVVYRGQPGDRIGSLVANRAGGSLSASISPRRWLQVGFDLPLVLYQSRSSSAVAPMDLGSSFGTSNLRLIPKFVVLHQADYGVSLAVVPTVIMPTHSTSDAYLDDHGFAFAPELALSKRWTGWRASMDAGYHARQRATLLNQTVDDELFARAGVGYQFADRGGAPVGVDVTMSGATAARAPFQRVNEDHLEALVGATYDFTNGAQLFGGVGAGLRKGYGTPDWRSLVGVRIGFGGTSTPSRPHEVVPPPAPPPHVDPVPEVVPPAPAPAPEPPPAPAPEPPAPVPPPPAPPVTIDNCKLNLNESVHFKTDRAEIESVSFNLLDEVAAVLKQHAEMKIEVEGHTDSRGDDAYNKKLSQRRSEAVVAYLVNKGTDKSRLTGHGFGEERPIADNNTDDGRAQNRRVVFAIVGCTKDDATK